MKTLIRHSLFAIGLVLACDALVAAPAADFMDKLQADSRPAADKDRDGSRRPVQVINLVGVNAGMTVVDVDAGGGWYTEVLSAAVGPSGKVISHAGPGALQRNNGMAQKDLAARLGNVEISFDELSNLHVMNADIAWSALEFHHNRDAQARVAYLQNMANMVKPGGKVVIIDHEGSPGMDNARIHRIAKEDVLAAAQSAGLKLAMESDLLHTNADDHTQAPFSPLLGRNTDRLILVFTK